MSFAMPRMRVVTKFGTKAVDLPDLMKGAFTQAVGPGRPNQKRDVQLLQQLLNRLTLVPHAALNRSPLKVDGILGPLTLKAIVAYQGVRFGTADGVVSPGRPTIRALAHDARLAMSINRRSANGGPPIRALPNLTDQIPLLPDPLTASNGEEMRANMGFHLLARTQSAVVTALAVAGRARDFLLLKKETEDNKRSAALLAKHFTHRTEPADGLYVNTDFILRIYRRSMSNVISRIASPFLRGAFVGDDNPPDPTWIASTFAGSVWTPPNSDLAIGGIVNLYPLFDDQTDHAKVSTIIHEVAHAVGTPRRSPTVVDDQAYPWQPQYKDLQMAKRCLNAACYQCFAHDATFGSPSMVRSLNHVEQYERIPFVGNNGTITAP